MAPKGEVRVYRGSCHCAATKFSVRAPTITTASSCNCNICSKHGSLFIYPAKGDFVIELEGPLTEYRFGKKTLGHKFCSSCGCFVLVTRGKRKEVAAVNTRLIPELEPWSLQISGKTAASRRPYYIEPVFDALEFEAHEANQKIYHGSCHCGAVTLSLRSRPLSEVEITECNCDFCWRKSLVQCYPSSEDLRVDGADNLSSCATGKGYRGMFCTICGVHLLGAAADGEDPLEMVPLNLRAMHGVEWDEVEVTKHNGRASSP